MSDRVFPSGAARHLQLRAGHHLRKHLLQDFTRIYHVHLEGNVRHNPTLAGTTYNVFGIQVGVGITLALRCGRHTDHRLFFHRVEKTLRRETKLKWLEQTKTIANVVWQTLMPDSRHTWLVPQNAEKFTSYLLIGSRKTKYAELDNVESLFKIYSRGLVTCRDDVVYDFDQARLIARVKHFVDDYNSEVDRYKRTGTNQNLDDFVSYEKVKWSRDLKRDLRLGNYAVYSLEKVRECLYRPFCRRHLFFDHILNQDIHSFPVIVPTPATEGDNRIIALTDLGSEKPFMLMMTNTLVDLHLVSAGSSTQCFPFYLYNEDGSNPRENITDWALAQFREHYDDRKISKWDIFYYTYGLLHHPRYREKFADNLKRELPRIPFAPPLPRSQAPLGTALPRGSASPEKQATRRSLEDTRSQAELGNEEERRAGSDGEAQLGNDKASGFWAFSSAGKEFARLHLDYEKLEPYPLKWIETPGIPLSYRVEDKMRSAKTKHR